MLRNRLPHPLEPRAKVRGLVSKTDPEIAVHAEMIAGNDENAFFLTEPVDEPFIVNVCVFPEEAVPATPLVTVMLVAPLSVHA